MTGTPLRPEDWGNLARAIRETGHEPRHSDLWDGYTMVNMQVWFHLLPAMEYLSRERDTTTPADSDGDG